jgi:hypothetical protein
LKEGHGLPDCSEKGHGYLVCNGSLFIFGKEVSYGLTGLKRRVTAYMFVASRVTATCYVKEGLGSLFTFGNENVL